MKLRNKRIVASLFLAVFVSSSLFVVCNVHAQAEPTLAEVMNAVISNIHTSDAWTCLYNQIFSVANQSAFDTAITQALNSQDYTDVIFIATLAQINGYSSQTINDSVKTALEDIPMCGSLPVTYTVYGATSATPSVPAFLLYDRFMLNAYQWAQNLDLSGWNITRAFLDFANAYLRLPENSIYGEMSWINPALNLAENDGSRCYDEYAETLDMFLMFAEAGVNATVSYNGQSLSPIDFADDMWLHLQSLWNGNYYNYSAYNNEVECELGNFATVISEYQNYRGNITYFNRVVTDLENNLLINGFYSDSWSLTTTGVLQHADNNGQLRLGETTGAVSALQMLYPYFNQTLKTNFQNMLQNGMWQGVIKSALFSNNQFQMYTGGSFGDDASSLGAMLLFLDGIVPDTGYLAINSNNEAYQDYRTCFPTSEWNFNYQNQTIRITVMAGNLSFLYGSEEVNQSFPSNGVYNIEFSKDWNNITAITKVGNINSVALQSVALQTIKRTPPTPTPSSTPTQIPKTTLTPTSTPKAAINPTNPPTKPAASPMPTSIKKIVDDASLSIVVGGTIIFLAVTALLIAVLKNRRKAKALKIKA
jgi:hypothetical protein